MSTKHTTKTINTNNSYKSKMKLTMKPTMKTTKFCKVCFDCGKEESVYTSHFVRSEPGPKGKIICPILLSLNCNYCKETGHTVKYCPILKDNNKQKQKENAKYAYDEKHSKKQHKNKTSKTNVFDVLNDIDAEADVVPVNCESVIVAPQGMPFTYATALASKPPPFVNTAPVYKRPNSPVPDEALQPPPMVDTVEHVVYLKERFKNDPKVLSSIACMEKKLAEKTPKKIINWADEESSSDEEDDDNDEDW